jgi:PPM family protein phosphatase
MPESNVVQITAFTHQGRVRKGNEDTIGVGDWVRNIPMSKPRQWRSELDGSYLMCVVADGMGGHAAGEIASQLVVNRIREESPHVLSKEQLAVILQSINSEIYHMMTVDRSCMGMGTTIAGLLLRREHLIWFNIGDSRLYRHRDDSLIQISIDDVPSQKKRSHVITQSLGGTETIQQLSPHLGAYDLPLPSRWLLCSDGLTDMVDMNAMEACMAASDLEAVSKLFELAMRAGAEDNISMIIISIMSTTVLPESGQYGHQHP